MLECQYVDHKSTVDLEKLSALSETIKFKYGGIKNLPPGLLLTCHRIEHYGEAGIDSPLNELVKAENISLSSVNTLTETVKRLARIAAGVQSEILGEWAIYSQVMQFIKAQDPSTKVYQMGKEVLEKVKKIRDEHNYWAPDHGNLFLSKLQQDTKSDLLVVVGSGMLGQRLAQQYSNLGYGDVMIVTRNPKGAKKQLDKILGSKVIKYDRINAYLDGSSFDAVIASADMGEDYIASVRDIVKKNSCRVVIDVCAKPVLTGSESITLHGSKIKVVVNEHNKGMADISEIVSHEIANIAKEITKKLEINWLNL